MKKIFNYIIAGCLATSFTGCLDMEPVSSITDTNFWREPAQFEAFNTGLHGLLRERSYTIFQLGEPRADIYNAYPFTGEATRGLERMFFNTLNAANPVIGNFGDFYKVINQLNLMIKHAEAADFWMLKLRLTIWDRRMVCVLMYISTCCVHGEMSFCTWIIQTEIPSMWVIQQKQLHRQLMS